MEKIIFIFKYYYYLSYYKYYSKFNIFYILYNYDKSLKNQAKASISSSAKSSFYEIALALAIHPNFVSNPITTFINTL
jgi:hypothetical protein